uniref:Uncharacterized protein n=1 Tax=Ananas comosus var. bracteatus TaxID=296719 RepID=A0A6V7QT60_ANACO
MVGNRADRTVAVMCTSRSPLPPRKGSRKRQDPCQVGARQQARPRETHRSCRSPTDLARSNGFANPQALGKPRVWSAGDEGRERTRGRERWRERNRLQGRGSSVR